ncbi:hypothetical protein IW262DRAFT_1276706 [Armillaria fumosa]|nr:hypothetical protein IW262DRAFT_1276706 [Armillaria fumosa]
MASISYRDSIRWLPDEASEPSDTVVLSSPKSNVFVDVRFIKGTKDLDWAFAGYRSVLGPNATQFVHLIDSRTLDALSVDDRGTNSALPDGRTLETGEMVNPATGNITAYEEIWREETSDQFLFVKNDEGTTWRARAGRWQVALGRDSDGKFWAWQAEKDENGAWVMKNSTENAKQHADLLPDDMMVLDKNWVVI